MQMISRITVVFVLCAALLFPIVSKTQDSSHMRVSLLTCTPGDELYSTFGHTAIRIVDTSSQLDLVFNYGTFDFDDPGFYSKFVRGSLFYFLSVENFEDFKNAYFYTNRGITEQVLNFSAEEKIKIHDYLYENSKDENKYYQYDFLFDNCTSRVRDLIFTIKKNKTPLKPVTPSGYTFRNGIHEYLDKNEKEWSKLGIDILLGSPTDKIATTNETLFLPDNLMKEMNVLDSTDNSISSTSNLYDLPAVEKKKTGVTPTQLFSFLLILAFGLSFNKHQKITTFVSGLDGLLFFTTGLIGCVLIFMWTSTEHEMCKNNYNLLWALPTNLILSFIRNKKNKFVQYCFGGTAIILLITVLNWKFWPQEMNSALIPIIIWLIWRSIFIFIKLKNESN